jgi:acetylglutamate kinase
MTRPWVVKIGGRLCQDPQRRGALARACVALDRPVVVVHGGGEAVSRLQQALGLEAKFVEGRRVTSAEDLTLVEMVLGAVNGELVRELQNAGRLALGLSGCDGGLLRCEPVTGLGQVGTPVRVDPRVVERVAAAGYLPVLAPLSLGPAGEPLNVNADEAACALAAALRAECLLLLSDVEGVRIEAAWQDEIAGDAVERLIASGEVTGGMIPKLRAAAAATAGGVGEVRIAGFAGGDLREVRGTRVLSAPAALGKEGVRHA